MANKTFEFMDLLRKYIGVDSYISASILVAETKEECQSRFESEVTDDRIYEIMLGVADRLNIVNPFKDASQFTRAYKTYCDFEEDFDWETIMAKNVEGYGYLTLSNALFKEYTNHFKFDANTVLIAEGEKFFPNLKKLVNEYPGRSFTITTESTINFHVISRIFAGYENVEILNTSIYRYGFTNNRYDLIFSVPNFGTRSLAEDDNFMCRDQDAVALENLLLHTTVDGELVITMPARITYGQGKVGELRRFVQQTYRIK